MIQSVLPQPAGYLAGKGRIFIDVNTLTRGLLLCGSHGDCLFRYMQNSKNACGVISDHVSNTAKQVVHSNTGSKELARFDNTLSRYIAEGLIEVVPDGNPAELPTDARFDKDDDDIVLATALSSDCVGLATLDENLAQVASKYIEVVDMVDPHAHFTSLAASLNFNLLMAPDSGSFAMSIIGLRWLERDRGRSYLVTTDTGFSIWYNHKQRRFELGFNDQPAALIRFRTCVSGDYMNHAIGFSFSTQKYQLIGAFGREHRSFNLKPGMEVFSQGLSIAPQEGLKSAGVNCNIRELGSTRKYSGAKSLVYALDNSRFFEHHAINQFELKDAVYSKYRGLFG